MNKVQAKIFGITMEITTDDPHYLEHFTAFLIPSSDPVDFSLQIFTLAHIDPPHGQAIALGDVEWIPPHLSDDGSFYAFKKSDDSDEWCCMFKVNPQWDQATLFVTNAFDMPLTIIPLMDLIFRNLLVLHGGFIVHASSVDYKGRGILFSAPSETGKTTQASLWQEHKGATLINDDHTALRMLEGKAHVFGVPWAKDREKVSNHTCPAHAVVFLEQAHENWVRKLEPNEVSQWLIPRCFMPYFCKEMTGMSLENLENFIKTVPFYLLKCRPDRDAVEALSRAIF